MFRFLLTLSLLAVIAGCSRQPELKIEQWDVFELSMNGPESGNPYMEVDFRAVVTSGDRSITVPGF